MEAILGFNTSEFLLEVSDAVERALVVGVGEMQRELKALAAQKGYKTVTDAKLGEACQRLLESMRRHFSKNMSKFELYASRNIFSLPVQDRVIEGNNGSAVEQAEIDELKRRYSELQDQHARLAGEVRDGDLLVRDMRTAMFEIRVACQTLNDHPLSDTMASLNTQQSTLKSLIKRARGKPQPPALILSPTPRCFCVRFSPHPTPSRPTLFLFTQSWQTK